ncbi:MAG TPA: T9SS type A sorting domain-containing protein [Bacteroidia bacterium]|jgi:hypothetical protein|nr:T9SS type A sorting domain-containing protein [Bacteroidia bacterium]
MKKILLLFFVSICFGYINAQTYTIGVPVYDTLGKQTCYMANINCPSGETSINTSFITHMPTGVKLYFKITSSQLATGCINITGLGVMNAGDSSLITTTNNKFEWTPLCNGGSAYFAILAIGVPANVNDSFYCKSQWYESDGAAVDGCSNYFMVDYFPIGGHPSCSINPSPTTSIKSINKTTYLLYPNPSNGVFIIETNTSDKQALQIFDVTGKIVLSQNINSKTNIDASGLDNGIYFIQVKTNENTYTQKVIVQH